MLLREPVGTIESHDCGSALPRPATGAPHLLVLAPLCTHSTPVGGGASWNLDAVCLKGADRYVRAWSPANGPSSSRVHSSPPPNRVVIILMIFSKSF